MSSRCVDLEVVRLGEGGGHARGASPPTALGVGYCCNILEKANAGAGLDVVEGLSVQNTVAELKQEAVGQLRPARPISAILGTQGIACTWIVRI